MRDVSRERRIGLTCGVLSVLLFSSFTLVSRLGFSSRLQLVDLAALRFGIGGTLLPLLSEIPSRAALAGVGVVTLGMVAAARRRDRPAPAT